MEQHSARAVIIMVLVMEIIWVLDWFHIRVSWQSLVNLNRKQNKTNVPYLPIYIHIKSWVETHNVFSSMVCRMQLLSPQFLSASSRNSVLRVHFPIFSARQEWSSSIWREGCFWFQKITTSTVAELILRLPLPLSFWGNANHLICNRSLFTSSV